MRNLIRNILTSPCLLISCILQIILTPVTSYSSTETWFTQKIDHFSDQDNTTFQQRYFLNKEHFKNNGPLLVSCGYEGEVNSYIVDSSAMSEYAQSLNGITLAIEHRYFGKSKPFESCLPGDEKCFSFLTVEQVLADCQNIITKIIEDNSMQSAKVFSFGGSYGGFLGYLMRVHFPGLVYGAIVSAAATKTINHGLKSEGIWFDEGVSEPYINKGFCARRVEEEFRYYSTRLHGLNNKLPLCSNPKNLNTTLFHAKMMMSYVAQFNYARPWPPFNVAHPLDIVCSEKNSNSLLLSALGLMYNTTGNVLCYNADTLSPSYDLTGNDPVGINQEIFGYLTCTQFIQPVGGKGIFYVDTPWSLNMLSKICNSKYNVVPNLNWWGDYIDSRLKQASRIIFVNAGFDPVREFSPLNSTSNQLQVIHVPNMAHCEDTLGSSQFDNDEIVLTRQKILNTLRIWVQEH